MNVSSSNSNPQVTSKGNADAGGAPSGGLSRRWTIGILALCFLFVLMPYLFWQATWFGKPLTETEIEKNLADREHPRKTQHALSQIADAMIRRDPSATRWYPHVVQLAAHPVEEIRVTAAWVMGQDNSVQEFRDALRTMLRDANPMVRRNAALALIRFQDSAGHDEIRAMLKPYAMPAPASGALSQRLKPGDAVNPGTLLARLNTGKEEREVRSQVPGTLLRWTVANSSAVAESQTIVEVEPDATAVWEGLRGLYLIGTPEDVPLIEPYLAPREGLPDQIRQQARATLTAIEKRKPRTE